MIGQPMGRGSQLLMMTASLAAAAHSPAPVRWTDLFEPDGSRWAAARTDSSAYVWTRGHFTRSEAEAACAEPHQRSEGWKLPTSEELRAVLSRDQAGDRFWVRAPGTQAYLDQDEGPNGPVWLIRTEAKASATPLDLICVRAGPGVHDAPS